MVEKRLYEFYRMKVRDESIWEDTDNCENKDEDDTVNKRFMEVTSL